jgi:type IV secretory pathway TrbF-like protein
LELCHVACGKFLPIAAETGKSGEAAAAALPHQKQKKVRVYLRVYLREFFANFTQIDMNADSAGIRYCFCTAALVFLRSVLYDKK